MPLSWQISEDESAQVTSDVINMYVIKWARGGERGADRGLAPHDPQFYTRNLNFD